MSRTAALSWAEFDHEAAAPAFDVLGDLTNPAAPRPADPRPKAQRQYHMRIPSLAPRSAAASVHHAATCPRKLTQRVGVLPHDGRSEAVIHRGAASLHAHGSRRSTMRLVGARQTACGGFGVVQAVQATTKACRRRRRPPARIKRRDAASARRTPLSDAASRQAQRSRKSQDEPGSAAARQSAPVTHELGSASDEARAAQLLPSDGDSIAPPPRQALEVPWRRVRRRESSSPAAQVRAGRLHATARSALPRAAGKPPPGQPPPAERLGPHGCRGEQTCQRSQSERRAAASGYRPRVGRLPKGAVVRRLSGSSPPTPTKQRRTTREVNILASCVPDASLAPSGTMHGSLAALGYCLAYMLCCWLSDRNWA